MKIFRFERGGKASYGILKEDHLFIVKGTVYGKFELAEKGIPLSEATLRPPVVPTKIVAVGRNYKAHAEELGNVLPVEPLLFLKPPSAVIGPNDFIIYPEMSKQVDYEGELAVVLKKRASGLDEKEPVEDYILGYTCFNDITARDLQTKDVQFTRAKSFDTFASVGPCIVTDLNPSALQIKTFLNGKLRQSSSTGNLIFTIPFLVRFISRIMTLEPGDIISTGTPAGVGPMQPGDRVDVQIEGIGTLSNQVKSKT